LSEERLPTAIEVSDFRALAQAAQVWFKTNRPAGFRDLFFRGRWAAVDQAHAEVTAGFNKLVFPVLKTVESYLAAHVLSLEEVTDVADTRGAGATLYKDKRTGAQLLVNRDEVRSFGRNIAWVLAWAREADRRAERGEKAMSSGTLQEEMTRAAGKEHS